MYSSRLSVLRALWNLFVLDREGPAIPQARIISKVHDVDIPVFVNVFKVNSTS